MVDVQGTFVSQKINKVRWLPEEYGQTSHFITGSWDDEDYNTIKVWVLENNPEAENAEFPSVKTEFKVNGDVTGLELIERNTVAVTSSDGDVRLLEIGAYEKSSIKEVHLWKKLHNFGDYPCSCTGVAVYQGDIVTIGEDGSINQMSSRLGEVTRSVISADSCALHSVCFLKNNEVVTGNVRGHMKVWDLRSQSNKPTASFLLSGDEQAATYLVRHPTQPHILLAGSESGALAVWDLRMDGFPASLINAHTGSVKEIQFHHENPKKLISSSAYGELWEWSMDTMTQTVKGQDGRLSWLPHSEKSLVKVDAILPKLHKSINTFHCDKSRIIFGADNEAVYVVKKFKY